MSRQLFVSTVLFALASSTAFAGGLPKISALKSSDFELGCGCSITSQRQEDGSFKTYFFEDLDERRVMRVNGKKVSPALVSSTRPERYWETLKVGDRFTQVYSVEGAELLAEYTTTFTCADHPDNDSCEVTSWDVDVTVSKDGQSKTYSGLRGDCGC